MTGLGNAAECGPVAMPDEPRLREKARAALRRGALPTRPPDRTWSGPGSGAVCAVCQLPVTEHELVLELEFTGHGRDPTRDHHHVHVHVRCFAAWEFERTKVAENPSSPGARDRKRRDLIIALVTSGAISAEPWHMTEERTARV